MRRIAIVRPEPGASATLDKARSLGLDAFAVPVFEIVPVPWTPPDPAQFDALLLTSANALRFAGPGLARLAGLPAYCVGEATAVAARTTGLAVAATGDGGVDRLLERIPADARLLHLCGRDRATPMTAHQILAIPVYASIATDDSLPAALDGTVVLAHSPRAAARLAELADGGQIARETVALAAISPAAAAAAGRGWARVAVASAPSDEALLALAAELCNMAAGE